MKKPDDHIKWPDAHLRKRVHGSDNLDGFNTIGVILAKDVYSLIYPENKLNKEHQRVLDWGCGCGRAIQRFRELFPNCDLYGSDVDKEAISWCKENLSQIATFSTNGFMPPINFPDEFFDFIYGISIFTHLPEDMEAAWLEELCRVTRQGGHVMLTIHGSAYWKSHMGDTGFYYAKNKTPGLPDYYGTSFHTKDYIYDKWGKFFTITKFSEMPHESIDNGWPEHYKEEVIRGSWNAHDLILCKKI